MSVLDIYSCPGGFPGGSDSKESACNAGDLGSIPGWERPPGGGHGNPFQYFCLENPMDRRAWWAAVHRATKTQSQLKLLSPYACWASRNWPWLKLHLPRCAFCWLEKKLKTTNRGVAQTAEWHDSVCVWKRFLFLLGGLITRFSNFPLSLLRWVWGATL